MFMMGSVDFMPALPSFLIVSKLRSITASIWVLT